MFWTYLNNEVDKAKVDGAKVIIQMDGNLWAGEQIIKGDPKTQNRNGKLFQEFLHKNSNLNVTNALPSCQGKVTRVRHVQNKTQESILDFFLVCDELLPLVTKTKIYENDELCITRYKGKVVKTDHKILSLELNMKVHIKTNHNKINVFNVRNKNCQKDFFKLTSEEGRFSKCFKSNEESIDVQFNRWKRMLDKSINACFRKIRVKERVDKSNIDTLMAEKKVILKQKKLSREDENKIDEIGTLITHEIAEKEYTKLSKVLGDLE